MVTRGHIHNILFFSLLINGPNELVLHYNKLERLVSDKHSSLLGTFVSYEENEVVYIWYWCIHNICDLQIHPIIQCHIRLGRKVLAWTNALAYWVHLKVRKKIKSRDFCSSCSAIETNKETFALATKTVQFYSSARFRVDNLKGSYSKCNQL